MTYTLNTIILEPLSKKKPKNAVILCHGYGGDGKDISILASYWRAHLPDTIFICPDAPERCAASPTGFQWFDLMDQTSEQILSKSLIAEKKLNNLIEEVKDKNNLKTEQVSLCGFSQGCMLILQTGIKRKDNIILMHGDLDQVVTIDAFLEAKDFFGKNNYSIVSKIFKNCEHRIPTEGSSLGLQFIKKHFN